MTEITKLPKDLSESSGEELSAALQTRSREAMVLIARKRNAATPVAERETTRAEIAELAADSKRLVDEMQARAPRQRVPA